MDKARSINLLLSIAAATAVLVLVSSVAAKTIGERGLMSSNTAGANRLPSLRSNAARSPQNSSSFTFTENILGRDDMAAQGSTDAPVDLNGDGRTDFGVVRNTGGGPSGQLTWFFAVNGTGTTGALSWGLNSDWVLMEDFDGDLKDDVTIWRPGPPGSAAYYIFQSSTNTARIIQFGQTGDVPSVIADYDNDGRADPAVFRSGSPALWFYLGSLNNPNNNLTVVAWGTSGDIPTPGDFDGDGRNDFGIARNNGTGQLNFWRLLSNGTVMPVVFFGSPSDFYTPGDYDGDGKTDIALARQTTGPMFWHWISSLNGSVSSVQWGAGNDFPVQGDYDADGRTDVAIWRRSISPGQTAFWVRLSSNGSVVVVPWGLSGDFPVAAANVF